MTTKNVAALLALLTAVTLTTACNKQQAADFPVKQAACKTAILMDELGGHEGLVRRVLANELSLEDAVMFVGGVYDDVKAARERLKLCDPVKAPPPDAGNKVL